MEKKGMLHPSPISTEICKTEMDIFTAGKHLLALVLMWILGFFSSLKTLECPHVKTEKWNYQISSEEESFFQLGLFENC